MTTERFYETIRPLFGGGLSQTQVDGVGRILDACMTARANRQSTAYILATAFHETGRKMQPVEENLNYSAERLRQVWPRRFTVAKAAEYAGKPAAIANLVYGTRMGNGDEAGGDGWRYRGRGDVQITGRDTYRRMGKRLGVDLEAEPTLAKVPGIAARILVEGMLSGAFTGVSLDDVSEPGSSPSFDNDRTVVNGRDRAAAIARSAEAFHAALADVDLLAKSRTIKAAKSSKAAAKTGAVASTAAAVGAAILGNTESVVGAASLGAQLGEFMPYLAPVLILGFAGLFVWMHTRQNKIEDARREDNEVRGV